jgi:hypothetical protein
MKPAPSIDFCIPAIGVGVRYLDYLIENLFRTAADPDRIRIIVSYHSDEDRATIEACGSAARIASLVKVPPYESVDFTASANHSAAINALARTCSADIVVLSDYDMAFLMPEWDRFIVQRLHAGGIDLFGVCYPPLVLTQQFAAGSPLDWLSGVSLAKYQRIPNLSFLAMKRTLMDRCFPGGRITGFDRYLVDGNMPFRLVNTGALAIENQIPMGMVQWLDTGYEIPELIARHELRHEALAYRNLVDQDAFISVEPFRTLDRVRQPEFFYAGDVPFLCHFKKGSLKAQTGAPVSLFDLFTANVENFLATRFAAARAKDASAPASWTS